MSMIPRIFCYFDLCINVQKYNEVYKIMTEDIVSVSFCLNDFNTGALIKLRNEFYCPSLLNKIKT